ncbi:MAG TPA: tetratricopeptide repeat protein [Terracidiphilus sp.]|jgi:hypothetical protein|nr:tetratricopeptide repeat protein [Terracidiphilus sp.]
MNVVLAGRFSRTFLIAIGVMVLPGGFCVAAPAHGTADRKLDELRRRADAGYVDQQIELAAAYLAGRGVPQDPAQAAHWYQKAAEGGSPEAQNQIGYFYQKGIGVRVDLERAVHWFQLAAASGMSRAKINLGVSYLKGMGVRKNASTARHLFLEAVDKGAGLGATFLGDMEYFGLGGPVDKGAGEKWFETGAKLRDPEAAYDLAYLYSECEGHQHNIRRAAELLRLSAGKGYVPGKHSLGVLLLRHPELAQPQEEARVLLEDASHAGNWRSTVLLGILARDGKGIGADASLAYYYFYLAGLQGGTAAQRLLEADFKALSPRLGSEERLSVAARADAFFDQHRVPLSFVLKEGDKDRNFPMAAVAESGAALAE